jgi:hypothetical protein
VNLRLPVLEGIIARRLLLNYRVRPDLLEPMLPPPFRPQRVAGWGMAGLCLIRLEDMRVKGLPAVTGLNSENVAHRIAVEWDDDDEGLRTGVFILQRHTNSRLNELVGGRLFPGVHQRASFACRETERRYKIEIEDEAGGRLVRTMARRTAGWPATSVFPTLAEASEFYRCGGCGWSLDRANTCEGMELKVNDWRVEPLQVEQLESRFFDDSNRFPAGSIEFDGALLMRGVQHEWHPILETLEAV